jgi:hypothetical protein
MSSNVVVFAFPRDPARAFSLDLDTMVLITKTGTAYRGVYDWTSSCGFRRMRWSHVKKIDFTQITYPALDGSYLRFVCPMDGEETCVYFRRE